MSGRRIHTRPLTILLLLAVLVTQVFASAPGHSDDHAQHCCPVCHASHAPLLSAAPILAFTPPSIRTYWRTAAANLPSVVDPWMAGPCTRGPPSFSFAA